MTTSRRSQKFQAPARVRTHDLLSARDLAEFVKTRRERSKSAPYLRLKDSKRTSKCQSIGELGTLLWKKFEKKSHNAEKTERWDPLGFFNIHFVGKYQKIEGGTRRWIFFEKSLTEPKKLKGGPFGPVEFLRWCKNTTS